jgi:riboflavin synthase
MFTGIVEERATVQALEGNSLSVSCRSVDGDGHVGDSIAVNGVCLTVVACGGGGLGFDLSEETLARSSLGRLRPGDAVNLERPVTLSARLGGHLVQGHVDGVGEIVRMEPGDDGGAVLTLRVPPALMRYVVVKGSIALDGISLTVAGIVDDQIRIALIPHTLAATTLGAAGPGDQVNVEVDLIAKYVERLMEGHPV